MRIAAFQRFPVFDDVDRAIQALSRDLAWADEQRIDLALFPECYLQGHSYDAGVAKTRALSLGDPQLRQLAGCSGNLTTTAIIGFFEKRNDLVYNSAMVVEAGRITGVYAKANPIEDGCSPGTDFPVWQRSGVTFGVNICADLRRPEIADQVVANGASLICCPLNMMLRREKAAIWREPCIESLQACAGRTGCWVVSSDVVGEGLNGWMSYGCTAVIRPDGTIAARVDECVEGVAQFEIDSRPHQRDLAPIGSMKNGS